MIKLYHFLYVQIYLMNLKRWGKDDDQNFITNLTLFVILHINVITALFIVEIFSSFHLLGLMLKVSKYEYLAIMVGLFFLQLFYFLYHGRYKNILNNFNIASKLASPRYYYPGTIYIYGSLFLLGLVVTIAFNLKHGRG